MLSIIVAIDNHYGIGRDNQLLCHLPNDLKHFKQITEGHTIVMGRQTYLSLPKRPLPKRRNIVLSRQNWEYEDGVEIVHSIEEVLSMLDNNAENFIIGGGSVYSTFLPLADKVYLTRIHHIWEDADTFFPELSPIEWKKIAHEDHHPDEKHEYPYSFEEWVRL
ncbi:MAG: dihydrofolate reductase [Paludibacteraceae bacterium]|nr:dihydrofolate reductase [Paludibacteraceae bacterium]